MKLFHIFGGEKRLCFWFLGSSRSSSECVLAALSTLFLSHRVERKHAGITIAQYKESDAASKHWRAEQYTLVCGVFEVQEVREQHVNSRRYPWI